MSELYTKDILRLAAMIPLHERLEGADFSITRTSRVCGSKVSVDISFEGGRISAFGQQVNACALGQASASLLARKVIGLDDKALKAGREMFQGLIKDGAIITDPDWAGFNQLAVVRDHPSRHMSVMLPFEALIIAFDMLEKSNA